MIFKIKTTLVDVSMNISTENLFIGNDFHILIYITRNLHLTCNIASKLSSSYIIQLESFKYPKSFFLNWTCQMSNVAGRFHHKPTIELQKFCFAYHYLTINNTKWWCQNQITVKTNWNRSHIHQWTNKPYKLINRYHTPSISICTNIMG